MMVSPHSEDEEPVVSSYSQPKFILIDDHKNFHTQYPTSNCPSPSYFEQAEAHVMAQVSLEVALADFLAVCSLLRMRVAYQARAFSCAATSKSPHSVALDSLL